MTARIIDGKAVAARVRGEVAEEVRELAARTGSTPGLATVLVGEDPASQIYVGGKQRASAEVGMVPIDRRLPADASAEEIAGELESLNADDAVTGILLQLPLPGALDGAALTALIDPRKDVDGLHPLNIGRLASGGKAVTPCTPSGCLIMAKSVCADLAGLEAVVIGRSSIVGKPMAQLLTRENCTVTLAHSRTRAARFAGPSGCGICALSPRD